MMHAMPNAKIIMATGKTRPINACKSVGSNARNKRWKMKTKNGNSIPRIIDDKTANATFP